MTLTSGADSAWLYDLLLDAGREHEYRRREGAASAAKLVGAAVALAVGGRLAAHDVAATYLASMVVCLLASVVALSLREASVPARRSPGPLAVYRQMAGSARIVVTHRPLLFAVLFSTLMFTLLRMGIYLHQPWLSAAGFDLARVGDLMALLSLAAALGAARIDDLRRVTGERALVVLLPAVLGVSYAVLGPHPSRWGIAMLVLQSLANGVYSPFAKELLNREILDSSHRATVLSVESMVRRLAFGAFAPLAGIAIDRFGGLKNGVGAGFYACAALGLAGALVLAARVARRRASFGTGFEGERTPTPLPELPTAPLVEPIVARASRSPRDP